MPRPRFRWPGSICRTCRRREVPQYALDPSHAGLPGDGHPLNLEAAIIVVEIAVLLGARRWSTVSSGEPDMEVSAISFGAWAIGGTWGTVDDEESMRALHTAIDAGVNFIDTADVYGDGRSERLVARLRRERPGETIFVATKAGRRLPDADPGGLQPREPGRLGRSQPQEPGDGAHRPAAAPLPAPDVYDAPRCSASSTTWCGAGKIRHYGVSVETRRRGAARDPAPRSADGPDHLQHVPAQARPSRSFRRRATRGVGILARVPLASGLLTGKLTRAVDLRRRRPPPLQPRRRGLRQGRDLLGRAVRGRARGGRASCGRWSPRARRWPSSRSAGS